MKKSWPASKVEMRAVESLIPYARNPRTHNEAQVAQIAASIREFGWTVPMLVDEEGGLIAGHGRVLAARQLGIDKVPVMTAVGWTDAQKRAYVIADNKLALNAGWDQELLRVEMEELKGLDFDLSLTGFSEGELLNVFLDREQGETDANAEWQGMPEFEQPDQMAYRSIIVHFANERDVQAFSKLVGQGFTEKTKFIWYPKQERLDSESKRYATD